MKTFLKDPDSILDYYVDWTFWLRVKQDDISTFSFSVPAGLTKLSESRKEGVCSVWVSGGVVDTLYTITSQVVTELGVTEERSFQLRVVQR